MLEQSHVPIVGVVVNGLSEDVQNWSSYGYDGAQAGISTRRREKHAESRSTDGKRVMRPSRAIWIKTKHQAGNGF